MHLRWTNLNKFIEIGNTDNRASLTARSSIQSKITPSAKKSTKVILDHVSGEAKPGEILALMGPSGSGKTTLMNVLSGRASYQEGDVSINGKNLDKASMKKLLSRVAYVKQQDIFFETLTVRDQLTYTAQLRISDKDTTKEARNQLIQTKVDNILKLLRLSHVADNMIMMCSGGEKKRVNIGTELLTDPSLILLDEPTSGLDSASAISLLGVLKDLAKNHGKTIITSIHQPNSATFLNTFDKLLMLSDGHAVYFGTPVDSLQYLKTKNLQCPEGYNAADHWMDLLVNTAADAASASSNNDASKRSDVSHKSLSTTAKDPKVYLQMAWDNDKVASELQEAADIQLSLNNNNDVASRKRDSIFDTSSTSDDEESKYVTSWWTQYKTLTHRALKKSQKTVFSPVNTLRTIATGIVVGIVYLNQRYTESDVFNIYAYFFFTMLYWVMGGMFEALFAFPQERVVILKERATASYRLSAYFCAMTTADMPVFVFMPFLILLIALLSVITGQGMGQLVGAAFDDIQIGQAVATVVVLFLMLLGGFFAQNLPVWLSWVQYISPFAYASNAALGVIFESPVPCDGSGGLGALCENGAEFASPADVLDS